MRGLGWSVVLLGVSWSPVTDSIEHLSLLADAVEAPGWELERALVHNQRAVLHNLELDVSLADPHYASNGFAARARTAIDRASTPWLSLHLGFASREVRFDGHMLPTSEPLERSALREQVIANVRTVQQTLDLPLLLENLDYCPEGAYEHVTDPAFISEVLHETGAELLLDLAHLRVTASWQGRPVEALLAELPLERVREIHVSSPRPLEGDAEVDGKLDDVHAELEQVDLDLLRLTLERADPRMVVLEYRAEAQCLQEQLGVVGALIGRRFRGRAYA